MSNYYQIVSSYEILVTLANVELAWGLAKI